MTTTVLSGLKKIKVREELDMYVDTLEKGSSEYDSSYVEQLQAVADAADNELEVIETLNPSDRAYSHAKFGKKAHKAVEDIKYSAAMNSDKGIQEQHKALLKYEDPTSRDSEIRQNLSALHGDPILLRSVAKDLSDSEFNALRMGSPRAVFSDRDGSAKLVPFVDKETVELEMRRRRPDTATRIDAFTVRRERNIGLATVLANAIDKHVNPDGKATGW